MRSRIALIGTLLAALVPVGGCGDSDAPPSAPAIRAGAVRSTAQAVDRLRPHPRAVTPSAGVAVDPAPPSTADDAPADALPQPRSDAEIRRELAASGIPAGDTAVLTPDGLAVAPLDAPAAVQAIVAAGNQIARLPYRYGGGHRTWSDTAYDCSASISYTFAAAGLISTPMVSGALAQWGAPGPGRWVTIFANGGHTFMYVAGLRFDTGGLRATGSRWQATPRDTSGFAVRHPPGL
jgi:hypothetical protein